MACAASASGEVAPIAGRSEPRSTRVASCLEPPVVLAGDGGAQRRGDPHGEGADAPGCADDEDVLAGLVADIG